MTSYDYGRVQSLLEAIAERALSIRDQLQHEDNDTFDLPKTVSRMWEVEHDVGTIKALLKRERVKRA